MMIIIKAKFSSPSFHVIKRFFKFFLTQLRLHKDRWCHNCAVYKVLHLGVCTLNTFWEKTEQIHTAFTVKWPHISPSVLVSCPDDWDQMKGASKSRYLLFVAGCRLLTALNLGYQPEIKLFYLILFASSLLSCDLDILFGIWVNVLSSWQRKSFYIWVLLKLISHSRHTKLWDLDI